MRELQAHVCAFDTDLKLRSNSQGMMRRSAVHLERLPDGFEFPKALLDRVAYDSERKLLVFHGFMTSADYYFLRACSNNADYIRALNELHDRSAFEVHCRTRIVPLWLWALVFASFASAAFVWLWWFVGSN